MDPPPMIGRDERRMHVRAYNFWVSLLGGRQFPSLHALNPARVRDFGDHGVLLDFMDGPDDPAIRFLGDALRTEGGMDGEIDRISAVPEGTLLTRLVAPYTQIVTNRAPVGFEAEFVNVRGNTTLYRGILLPFSSDGIEIDHVYAVINWKELASAADTLLLSSEMREAIRIDRASRSAQIARAPLAPWADGPSSSLLAPDAAPPPPDANAAWSPEAIDDPAAASGCGGVLADHLAAARGTIEQLHSAELRARSALYRALGLAYDFSCAACSEPQGYAEMLAAAGLRRQRRTSMVRIVRLVFGSDYDRKRLAEFATVLAHGHRLGLPSGGLRRLLEGQEDGVKAIVAAERAARRAHVPNPASGSPRRTPRGARVATAGDPQTD
jgi:hypothetical protein